MTLKHLTISEITSDRLDACTTRSTPRPHHRLLQRPVEIRDAKSDTYRNAWHSARRRVQGRVQAEAALDQVGQLAESRRYTGDRKANALPELRTAFNGPKEN